MGGRHLVNGFCEIRVFWVIFLRKIAKIAQFLYNRNFFHGKIAVTKKFLDYSQRKLNVDFENGIGFCVKLRIQVVMTSQS